jgi:hypothetical protein
VRVEVAAFSRVDQLGTVPRALVTAKMALALLAYEHRAHPSGRAVCLLAPRRRRLASASAALVVMTAVLGALAPVAAWVLLGVVVVASVPAVIGAARALPANLRLRQLTPPVSATYLHSLASTQAGAGAELLCSVVDEADRLGRSVVLDAANEELVRYYQRFGFRASGPAVRMPNGAFYTRMSCLSARSTRRA